MKKAAAHKGHRDGEEHEEERMKKGGKVRHYAKGGAVGAEHGYSVVGKHFGPEPHRGNAGEREREWHEESDDPQVKQDPREGHERGENVNFYHNMIHHGEGGMIAPGEAPLTVGPGPGSKFRGPVERLKPAGE